MRVILIVILSLLIPFPAAAAQITVTIPDEVVTRVDEICPVVARQHAMASVTRQECAELMIREVVLRIATQMEKQAARDAVEGLWPLAP